MKRMTTIYRISLFCATLFLTGWSFGQSTFVVESSNFQFAPATLSISVGDTVRWTNIGGSHNVNGTIATFSANPASFSNPADGAGAWVFDFVFTIAGNYNYQCGIHGSSMPGTITVNGSAALSEKEIVGATVYPNPAMESFTVENTEAIESIEIYNLKGERVLKLAGNSQHMLVVDSEQLEAGVYLYTINDVNGKSQRGSVVIE